MTRPPIILVALTCLCSCNYRIFTDGKFSHKENGLTTKYLSSCDSCLVFEPFESLPDSLTPICQISIRSPYFWMNKAPLEYAMIDRASSEAQKAGANVISIYDRHEIYHQEGTIFKRLTVKTRLYFLKEPFKSSYQRREDSLKTAKQGLCIVHIKSYLVYGHPIFWNDTLVGNCEGFLGSHGEFKRRDFVFSAGGLLSCQDKLTRTDRDILHLEKGKEYYVVLRMTKGGYWFYEVDEHRW